uniref:Uncharacterized protein n=1 Tax=Arundo donax TaxID=35708 RepID=A0A0A8Z024_ARUDO
MRCWLTTLPARAAAQRDSVGLVVWWPCCCQIRSRLPARISFQAEESDMTQKNLFWRMVINIFIIIKPDVNS